MIKPICDNCHGTCHGVEPVDLILQTGRRAEVLYIAIDGVCEVDIFVFRVDGYIVQGVKLSAEVVVEDNCRPSCQPPKFKGLVCTDLWC